MATPIPLSNTNLKHLRGVRTPGYDRRDLRPAVVHLGVGGFHRAHQALYLDEAANRGASDWGIVGVSLKRSLARDALTLQDCLYTVVERHDSSSEARVVGSLLDCLYAPEQSQAVVARLADPRTEVVTMTITGGGYKLDSLTGSLDVGDEEIEHDIERPRSPVTAIGYLVEGLRLRRLAGVSPFTVLSCDNVPSNGGVARTAVVTLAEMNDPGLARWIGSEVSFPSSVVDRITPVTDLTDRERLTRGLGLADRWPVLTEPHSQWTVEESFAGGRAALEQVGVEFVADVAGHEIVKKRLLNGSHCAMGYLGSLAGLERSDEVVADPQLRRFLTRLMDEEISPALAIPEGLDLSLYKRGLMKRLGNRAIADKLSRLCARGSTKMPAYLLPSLHDAVSEGRPRRLLVLAVAAWMRYLRGMDIQGRPISVQDARGGHLGELARRGGSDPRPLLAETSIFGGLGQDEEVVAEFAEAIAALDQLGPRGALDAALAGEWRLAA